MIAGSTTMANSLNDFLLRSKKPSFVKLDKGRACADAAHIATEADCLAAGAQHFGVSEIGFFNDAFSTGDGKNCAIWKAQYRTCAPYSSLF